MSAPYGDPDRGEDVHRPHSSSPYDGSGSSNSGVNIHNLTSSGAGDEGGLLVASSIAPRHGEDKVPRSSSLTSSLQAAAAASKRPSSLPGTSLHSAAASGSRPQPPPQQQPPPPQHRHVYQEQHHMAPMPPQGQYQYQHQHQPPPMHQYAMPHHVPPQPPHPDHSRAPVGPDPVYGNYGEDEDQTQDDQATEGYDIASSAGKTDYDDIDHDDITDNGPVKLFVGQVPKTMGEEDIFPTFSDFGPIKELLVIRDKHTGQHRGCAFVTYWSASAASYAQQTLHDKFTFPQGRKPVQIRPAAEPSQQPVPVSSPEAENKLFVGMTSRNADEHAIRELFSPFGEIREIYIIRNADGSNKGCAFLKFAQRDSALEAIEALHENYQMEGATRPLIVKFADSKAQRKARSAVIQRNLSGSNLGQGASPVAGSGGYYMPSGPPVPVYPGYQQQGPSVPPPVPMPPHTTQYTQPHYPSGYPPSVPASNPPPPSYLYQHPSYPSYYPPVGPTSMSPVPPNATTSSDPYDHQPRTSLQSRQRPSSRSPKPYARQEAPGAVTPRPREGPAGANLFIYHLPHDLTDADLATAFNPFGNVISAKVYVDKYTGESKGFGFVSYDSVISAEQAIEQMNGFQIGTKRLKVQHKRINKPPPAGFNHPGADAAPRTLQQAAQGAPILPSSLAGMSHHNPPREPGTSLVSSLPQSMPPGARYHPHHHANLESFNVDDIGSALDGVDINATYQSDND